ncbi:hypothetical protein [Stenotrophomonas sp. 24(2023)]|uniref:hypothetical protein n=1 Tax=Stenotrophomonas sp. 24(2023) TaxID=3068324 RepID=UPI0027E17BF3|nr:hypothetical protein [Stenotrophomonas sp. 24(2023)]WMJ68110.1 hypothetical protein Q9R17_12975 [Stenotrophomonas sp. 24(2023)]
MATTIENYFQPGWREQMHTCAACEWKGNAPAMTMEVDEDATEYACPVCENPLLVVMHPDLEQVQAAAASGNDEAQAYLAIIADAPRPD